MVSHALDHMWWENIEACLTGHICADTLVCADALAQHSIVAKHLGFTLKTLVAVAGQTVREGVFHLQHINAHHSTLTAISAEHTISILREDYSTSLFSGANEIRLLASQLIQQVQNTG